MVCPGGGWGVVGIGDGSYIKDNNIMLVDAESI